MPNSSPAWIRTVEVAVVVAGEPTPTEVSFDEVVEAVEAVEADVEAVNTEIATNVVKELQDIEADVEALKTEVDDNWDEEKELWFPTNKRAAGGVGNYSGTDTTYQTVVSWTIATGWEGELKEILILADDYDHTYIQITVGSVTWCTNWSPQGAMPIIFEDLRLAAGQSVTVQAKSDDGTAIVVDAIIVAKEIS